jgi:hypothetical protein
MFSKPSMASQPTSSFFKVPYWTVNGFVDIVGLTEPVDHGGEVKIHDQSKRTMSDAQ